MAAEHVTLSAASVAADFVAIEGWTAFGDARLGDFARERLGRSGRWLRDLAALGNGLARLPALRGALSGEDGGRPLGRVAAIALARTGSLETIDARIVLARQCTVRELLVALRGRREAAAPPGPTVADCAVRAPDRRDAVHDAECAPPSGCICLGSDEIALAAEDDLSVHPAHEVRLVAPEAVRTVFDEAFDLHRAVCGHETSLASFVEALVAEISAGPSPPDIIDKPLEAGRCTASIEAALERANGRWRHLDPPGASMVPTDPFEGGVEAVLGDPSERPAVPSSANRLGDSPGIAVARESPNPEALASRLVSLVDREDELERQLGRVLHGMAERNDWASLGFAGVGHYAEERLGMARRTAEKRAGILRALRALPIVHASYESGRIGLEAAWLTAQILGRGPVEPAVETAWVEHASSITIKRLRDELRRIRLRLHEQDGSTHRLTMARVPDGPEGDAAGPGISGHRARTPETEAPERSEAESRAEATSGVTGQAWTARFRDAVALERTPPDTPCDSIPTTALLSAHGSRCDLVRRAPAPRPASDTEWHASMRRFPGLAQERLRWLARAALDPGRADVFLRLRLPAELAGMLVQSIESERRRLGALADAIEWDAAAEPQVVTESLWIARQFAARGRRLPAWVGLFALLEDAVRTWDDPRAFPQRKWDETYSRDGWRCMAPGCTGRRRMEDHHLVYRAHEGVDDLWNQLCLCAFHHRQGEHGELARCRGQAPLGVRWRLGRAACATWYQNERILSPGTSD